MNHQIIFGTSVLSNRYKEVGNPVVDFPGKTLDGQSKFSINENIMSKHILLIGGSGCGKTNAFCYTTQALRQNMTQNDIAIIFDTKGEFYDNFAQENDYVIGNSARFRQISHSWNLFHEILADGWDRTNINMNARELAAALFHGRGSESQPFFCNAARDIFRGMLLHFLRSAESDPQKYMGRLNNHDFIKTLEQMKVEDYIKIFESYEDLRSMLSYFGDGKSNQALGVFGEMNNMINEYFIGILAENRVGKSLSMRNAVRGRGGRAIFVEYDISVGETLTPVYRLLIDQALKEALGRSEKAGNVYFIADEFKLLPKLQHIDDALNFGRGLGVKVMAGIQSIDQLYDIYGREKGAVIVSGFGSVFAFHANDSSSREYITNRFGRNIMIYEYSDMRKNTMVGKEREGYTIEEWDQNDLGVGQAVIALGYEPPFLFQFDEYGKTVI